MLPEPLAAYIDPMIAMAGGQFPRACNACRRPFADFKQFVRETKPIGRPTLAREVERDPISMISWTNCPCGSTLILKCADAKGEMHGRFAAALEEASRKSGNSTAELMEVLRAEVRRRVLTDP